MTEEQALKLGKRAVAAGWRVWPGTLSMSGTRCTSTPIPLLPSADDIPDFRDPATLGILRAQVVALVPRAAETVVMRWFGATIGATVRWCAAGGGWIGPEHWAHGVGDNWPVEALVACLEAAKKGEL